MLPRIGGGGVAVPTVAYGSDWFGFTDVQAEAVGPPDRPAGRRSTTLVKVDVGRPPSPASATSGPLQQWIR